MLRERLPRSLIQLITSAKCISEHEYPDWETVDYLAYGTITEEETLETKVKLYQLRRCNRCFDLDSRVAPEEMQGRFRSEPEETEHAS